VGWIATLPLASQAQVLVLGSVHLSELPECFNPALLQGVLDRLAAFRP
jgi:hypothetical protein